MALVPQERSLPRESRAAEAPAPGFFDAIGASFRVGQRDIPGSAIDEETHSYKPIVDALTAANGKPWTIYVDPHSGRSDADGIWREVAAIRARRPDFLAELGTREQWEQATRDRLAVERGRDRADEEKSGVAPWLIGKVGAAAVDPFQLGTALIGFGPASSIGKLALQEAAINALSEAVESPLIAAERKARGEELTLGEAAGNIAGAAVFGAGMSVAGRVAGDYVLPAIGERARSALYPHLPAALQERVARGMTIADAAENAIGRDNMTPFERGAVDVLNREAGIVASNPFVPDGAGRAAHLTLLEEAMQSVMSDAPSPTLKARLRASSTMQPTMAGGDRAVADRVFEALIMQESGGRAGVPGVMTRYGQAQGMTQVLDSTGEAMAKKLGIPWHPHLMRARTPEGAAYQRQIGRAYFEEGLVRYGGDVRKALAYYHGGPDERKWGPKTRAYVEDVLARIDTDIPRVVATGEDGLARAEAELGDAMRAREEAIGAVSTGAPRVADLVEAPGAVQPRHIADQVGALLEANGFTRAGDVFTRRYEGMADAGTVSDGARVITLQMDETGRWLERLDGFDVARDADLRNYADNPLAAVQAVMEGQPLPEPLRDIPAARAVDEAPAGAPPRAAVEAAAEDRPLQLLQQMWERQAARGERQAHVWAARAMTGDVVKTGGPIKGWSLSKRDVVRRFGGEDVRIVKIKPPSRATRDGFDDPQGDLFAVRETARQFSDPDGAAVMAQRASLEHDLKAVLHGRAADSAGGDPAMPAMAYRVSEEGPEITAQQLADAIAEEDAAIAAVRGCL